MAEREPEPADAREARGFHVRSAGERPHFTAHDAAAYNGHHTIITAISVCQSDGPSAATIVIASTGPGSARKMSVMRISTASIHPPLAPATSPIRPPIKTPDEITSNADNHVDEMPKSTREKMSRPTSSVPSRKPCWNGWVNGLPGRGRRPRAARSAARRSRSA